MNQQNNYIPLILIAATIIIAGVYYWQTQQPKCKEICMFDDTGSKECAVVCESGATPETITNTQQETVATTA
jgi:hypothetical protein